MAQVRAPMPASRRAKQFSMFDALKGLKEALAAKERQPEPRKELSQDAIEELNRILLELYTGQVVTVIYYCNYEHAYQQLTGVNMSPRLYTLGRASCTPSSLETEQFRRHGCTLTQPVLHGIIDVSKCWEE